MSASSEMAGTCEGSWRTSKDSYHRDVRETKDEVASDSKENQRGQQKEGREYET